MYYVYDYMERWCTDPLELPLVRGGTVALQLPSVER